METQTTRPKPTPEEIKRCEEIYKALPNGLKKVGTACELALDRLMKKGYSFTDAENMVLEILKESKPYLDQKMYGSTIKAIEMIFD